MPRVILNRSGDIRERVFYRFGVPFNDEITAGVPTPDWLVVHRTPVNDALLLTGKETYMWIEITGNWETRAETADCPVNKEHIAHRYLRKCQAEANGGTRLSPIVVTSDCDTVVLSPELQQRIQLLKLRGARIDPIDLHKEDTGQKLNDFWLLQFVGKAVVRLPMIEGGENRCPFCGRGKVMCEGCGEWYVYCDACKKQMVIMESMHEGRGDKRLPIEKEGIWRVLEGRDWDGGDLIQSKCVPFASKRFIDWLLRIHAAPFYAEPVYFCVDGMNDQQKKWFDELQKPFEV